MGKQVARLPGYFHQLQPRRALGQGLVQPQRRHGQAVAPVPHPHVRSYLVPGPLFLVPLQGGTEGAADDAQRRRQHQEDNQAARRNGVAAHPPQSLNQPDRPHRLHDPRQQSHRQRKEPQHNQPQGQQTQHRPQQQGEVDFQHAPAQWPQQEGITALYLPPEQPNHGQQQEVQVVAVQKRGAGRPGPGLAKLHYALPRRRQRCQRQHQHRKQRPGGPQQKGAGGQGNQDAVALHVEKQAAQDSGHRRGQQGADGHRRYGQQEALDENHQADL